MAAAAALRYHHRIRLVAGSLLTAVLAAVPAASDSVDDYVLAQLRVRNIPGVSVAVVKDGRIVKAAGYGIANLELQAPATAQTVYELGSISKQFAADAVLLLAEDGALGLDDLLSKYSRTRHQRGRASLFVTF